MRLKMLGVNELSISRSPIEFNGGTRKEFRTGSKEFGTDSAVDSAVGSLAGLFCSRTMAGQCSSLHGRLTRDPLAPLEKTSGIGFQPVVAQCPPGRLSHGQNTSVIDPTLLTPTPVTGLEDNEPWKKDSTRRIPLAHAMGSARDQESGPSD